jgi:armadillo repeat-containing protein 8
MSSEAIPSMLSILSSLDCPKQLGLAILKTLNTIADRYPLQNVNWPQDNRLAEILFTSDNIRCFAWIIAQNNPSSTAQTCATLAASIIARLCTEESHKAVLTEHGVLDALALKVASFIVAQGFVLPGAENHLAEEGALSALPQPAPSTAKLGPILRAVSIIVENSKWRAEHFLSSPAVVTVFPGRLPEFSPADIKRNPWGMPYLSGSAVPRQNHTNPMDALLPIVPLAQTNASTNFPPLVPMGSFHKRSLSFLESSSPDEDETALVPWLFHMIRTESGLSRVMAARLVTALFRLGLARKHRIPMFSYLVTPLLLRMLDKEYDFRDESDPEYDGMIPMTLRLKEEVPSILATLVMDTQELQKHAVEANAIKVLSQLLKETYNPHSEGGKSMWYAESKDKDMPSTIPLSSQMGPVGYSPMTSHIMRYREGILRALAALAPFRDEYRKAICENGVVPYIIDSLKPRPPSDRLDVLGTKNTAVDGNPIPTLLAACGAARALTRSVSVLRTSLIDAGVAAPLFELVKHRDVEVQIAATSVVCNIALDFSPMKEVTILSCYRRT